MNARERLLATIEGRPVDRIPIFCNLLDQGARELGLSTRAYYASGDHVAEGQLRMRARFGYDNVWALFYVGKEAELFGDAEIAFADDGPPNVARAPLAAPTTLDDVARIELPRDLAAHPAMIEPLRCLRALRREVGGRHPICVYVTASTTLPALAIGMERWMSLLLGGPADVRDALIAKCSELVRQQIALYRAEGADVILYASPFGSTDFLPRAMVRDLVVPWVERDLEGGVNGVVYYAGSARVGPVIELVRARVPLRAWYLGPLDDLASAKRTIGDTGLCAGVINDIRLVDDPPERVRAEVRRILGEGMPGGRFLFGTVLMPCAIPEANVRAMLDAARELGGDGSP